jgi:hypothetical protein
MKTLIQRRKRICRWFFVDGGFLWAFAVLVFLSICAFFRNVTWLIPLGTLLQIVGVWCLLAAFRHKLILFKGKPIKNMIKEYFLSFPGQGKIHSLSASMKASGSMSVYLTVTPKPPEENLQDVIRYFTRVTEDLRAEISESKKELTTSINNLESEMKEKISCLTKEVASNSTQMEMFAVAKPWQELFGIGMFLLGMLNVLAGTLADVH